MKDKTFWSLLAIVTLAGWNAATAQSDPPYLDVNETLLTSEAPPADSLHVMDADGRHLRPFVSHPQYTAHGSPAWTRDGTKLAFDAWRSGHGETYVDAHIFTCNADGSQLKDLGIGAMPSWSPDGSRLVFSNYSPRGVCFMNADGTERALFDAEGWGAEWSPTANKIAYSVRTNNIVVHNLDRKAPRMLLDDRYTFVFWGMAWSPDGNWIAFKAETRTGTTELAVVYVEGHEKGFRVLLPAALPDMTDLLHNPCWSPDGKQIIAAVITRANPARQLYLVEVGGKEPAKQLSGLEKDRWYNDMAWSPDGKQIVVSTRRTGNEPVVQAAPGQPRQPYKVERADGEADAFFYAPERTGGQAASAAGEQDPVVAELRGLGAQLVAKGARASWSPDGKRIAVGKMPFGSGVAVVDVTGVASGSPSRLSRVFTLDSEVGSVMDLLPDGKDPAWSPDGKWIAFTREIAGRDGPREEIWVTAADQAVPGKPAAGSPRLLGTGVMATWSADATTVFFSKPQTHEIFSLRMAKLYTTSVWRAIGDQFPDLWYPVVHPDGRYVAYHADGQLKIADMAAGKIVAGWPLDGWRGWLGSWSPDGSRLGYGAFGGEDKGLWELPFVFMGTLKLSPPRRILSGSCTLPSWSPDGSKLAFDFRSPQRGYEVWMVDTKRLSAAGVSTTSEVVGSTVRVFRLRHAKAQDVVQQIRRMLARGGLGAVSQMNAIVVSGDAETLKTVGELIEKLDLAPPEPAAAAKLSQRGEGDPTQKYQRASISELEQAIAKLQRDLTLAEDKTREAAAAMQHAAQAEKAASGEAKTAALLRRLKAEVAAQRERNASARIKSEFQAACKAYREAIASPGTVAEKKADAPPTASSADERLSVLEVYRLKRAKAEATAKELTSLFAGQENYRFVADPRTNALIVVGTRAQQEKIQKLIATLDVPAPGER